MLSLWTPYNDFGLGNLRRTLSVMDELHREMGTLLQGNRVFGNRVSRGADFDVNDDGDRFIIRTEVPGLSENDIDVTVTGETLSIRGERHVEAPEGYSTYRQERSSYQFSRSFTLPTKVDAEKAQATVKNGIFELVLPKAPEAQPRKISVKAN